MPSVVASVSGLSICACPFYFLFFFVTCLLWPVLPVYLDCLFVLALSVFSFSSSRVFCSRCCQCIWIVYLCLPFLFSLTFISTNTFRWWLLDQRPECIPCNYNYSIKHILIDCLDVSDERQNFYNINNLYDLFTNVTILKFLKEIDLYPNI